MLLCVQMSIWPSDLEEPQGGAVSEFAPWRLHGGHSEGEPLILVSTGTGRQYNLAHVEFIAFW